MQAMAIRKIFFAILFVILTVLIAAAPDSSSAQTGKARLYFYWPCNLIEIPGFEALKSSADIFVDGKRVGNIVTCEYAVVDVNPGPRKLSVHLQNFMFDWLPAAGVEYNVKQGQEWFFRLSYFQTVEWNEVPARVGRPEISRLKKK